MDSQNKLGHEAFVKKTFTLRIAHGERDLKLQGPYMCCANCNLRLARFWGSETYLSC